MDIHRTRFKKDIVAEFAAPNKPSNKVVILCFGLPSTPCKRSHMEFFAKKNYWVIFPRYRGSWESGGKFLAKSPHLDVIDVIDGLARPVTDLYSGKKFQIPNKKIYIMGSSFGGPAAILASRDKRVTRVFCNAPVIDWKDKALTLDKSRKIKERLFGEAYRISDTGWKKLKTGKYYNPMQHVLEIDGHKIIIFHAKDDKVTRYQPAVKFAKLTGAKLKLYKKGGHLPSSFFEKPSIYRQVTKFLNQG